MKFFKLSYKWVSWRSPKINTYGFKQNKIDYIKIFKYAQMNDMSKLNLMNLLLIDLHYQ